MKFFLASLILFLGMYAFAEQDELEALLEQSTCNIVDLRGQPDPASCDGFAQKPALKSQKELGKKLSVVSEPDEELEIE